MQAVSWQNLRNQVLTLVGIKPADAQSAEMAALDLLLQRSMHRVWEYYPWPDVVQTEQRPWRNAWSNTVSYASGAEVYHVASAGNYWRANATISSGGTAPGVNASWIEITDLETYLPSEPTGFDAIGTPLGLYWDDPRQNKRARRLAFTVSSRGLEVDTPSAPVRPWLQHRLRPWYPGTQQWSATATYVAGDVRFFGEDWYEALETTTAGESPTTHPAKWEKLAVPHAWTQAIVRRTYADWLRADRQNEKAYAEESSAETELYRALDAVQVQAGQNQTYRRIH